MSEDKDTFVHQTIFYTLKENHFLGSLLQELTITLGEMVPTAGLSFDKKSGKFVVYINPEYFRTLNLQQRIAMLIHELMHFTNGHLFRFEKIGDEKQHTLKNIAADMAINQFIPNLPEGVVKVQDWYQKDGSLFPHFKPMEVYFELLQETTNKPQNDGEEKDSKGDKEGRGRKGPAANYGRFKDYKPFDSHDWEQLSEEEKQRVLQEAKTVVERTVDKMYNDHSLVPDSIKSMMKLVEDAIEKLNYKNLLKYAIKKTLNAQDRSSSWNRKNKRYGSYAPGTAPDKVPFLHMYIDTSGSVSSRELEQFFQVIDGFLGAGSKRCMIGQWHTQLVSFKKYKMGQEITVDESGGTDPQCVIDHIHKTNPDLSIILTDGCYDTVRAKGDEKIIWVITKEGQGEHPNKHIGRTIKLGEIIG